ncbi:MAG: hypothetical protein ACO3FE_09640, partial [Planctomycetaceae bacterium]
PAKVGGTANGGWHRKWWVTLTTVDGTAMVGGTSVVNETCGITPVAEGSNRLSAGSNRRFGQRKTTFSWRRTSWKNPAYPAQPAETLKLAQVEPDTDDGEGGDSTT